VRLCWQVGELHFDRNPSNYFQDVEQASFAPANVVPGIGYSPDRMLQVRDSLAFQDNMGRWSTVRLTEQILSMGSLMKEEPGAATTGSYVAQSEWGPSAKQGKRFAQ
jgi:hypothetical protein